MCTWRRPEYFHRTLRCLETQQRVRVELHVWNNNPDIAEELEVTAAASRIPVRFHHSPENIGGFGRFHLARMLAPVHPFVVFIDDDQLFGAHTIATLRREARPRSALGVVGVPVPAAAALLAAPARAEGASRPLPRHVRHGHRHGDLRG